MNINYNNYGNSNCNSSCSNNNYYPNTSNANISASASSYDIFSKFRNEDAFAIIKGGPLAPNLTGKALLYQLKDGVYIQVYVCGIPPNDDDVKYGNSSSNTFHAFHIHEFGNCIVGDPNDPFLAAGGHWNIGGTPHEFHTGDLPQLLSNNGTAMMSFLTKRFKLKDAIGRSFIIHKNFDTINAQPSGNAGSRLACGIIQTKSSSGCCH